MEIMGRDPGTECYRIAVDVGGRRVVALLPERFAARLQDQGRRPSHETAYDWIARHKTKIEDAIERIANGQRLSAPYDEITLLEES